jgi:hypothetical protein
MSQNEQGVVDLVDAGVPADQGLSSLGLLMQLAGNVFGAYAALATFAMLLIPNDKTLWILVIGGASTARSLFHRMAGSALLYGTPSLEPTSRLAATRRYILFGLGHSLGVGLLLAFVFHASQTFVVGVAGGLAVWPATLAVILAMPRFRRFRAELPVTEDKGFEGASILMTVLGLCGVCAAGTLLLVMLDMPGKELQKGPGVLVALSLAMLVVRSVLHVQAGLSGLRETSVDRSVELANRYANFGVISSFCAAGALMLYTMAARFDVAGLADIVGICWVLMAWPMIIRKFFSDRQFADLLAGEQAPIHRRAPDAGLTSLGWLLIGYAAFSATCLGIQLALGADRDLRGFQQLLTMGSPVVRSMWWSVGMIVLQGWAGYELVRMSAQSRVIATVSGVVGAAVNLYIAWPMFDAIRHSGAKASIMAATAFGPTAIALIIPIATVVLVNRKIAPTARARFRSRPTPGAPSEPSSP